MKLDILAIGVHPDDVELGCSGTLLKHIDQGKKVGILDLTRGELGTRGSAELRDIESADSAKIMGLSARENLGMADGFFVYSKENLIKIIRVIRKYQPEIVLANPLSDRHPDHGRAGKLVADACFYAGLLKVPTYDDAGELQLKWRPKAVYHYMGDRFIEPDFAIDITDYMDKKMEAVLAFKSQFFNPNYGKKEDETPISGEGFMEYLKAKAVIYGRPIGAKYAEGFTSSKGIGVNNLFDLL